MFSVIMSNRVRIENNFISTSPYRSVCLEYCDCSCQYYQGSIARRFVDRLANQE
jgi:hypothetical protein